MKKRPDKLKIKRKRFDVQIAYTEDEDGDDYESVIVNALVDDNVGILEVTELEDVTLVDEPKEAKMTTFEEMLELAARVAEALKKGGGDGIEDIEVPQASDITPGESIPVMLTIDDSPYVLELNVL